MLLQSLAEFLLPSLRKCENIRDKFDNKNCTLTHKIRLRAQMESEMSWKSMPWRFYGRKSRRRWRGFSEFYALRRHLLGKHSSISIETLRNFDEQSLELIYGSIKGEKWWENGEKLVENTWKREWNIRKWFLLFQVLQDC